MEMKFRFANFPVPEPYLVALVVGILLEALVPWTVFGWPPFSRPIGLLAVVLGLLLAVWSVLAWGASESAQPEQLVVVGPYRYSRNPMYVAWFLIDLGSAFVLHNQWLIVFVMLAAVWTHAFVILPEEHDLHNQFGQAYQDYKMEVRRYL